MSGEKGGSLVFVDLEGTLLPTDLAWEARLASLRGGQVQVELLPYREDVVAMARAARTDGREVVLVTRSERRLADAIAAHLGCFTSVVSSDGATADDIARGHAGGRPFDYVPRPRAHRTRALLRALRPHQWVKNALLFLPLLMAHRLGDVGAWLHAMAAFVSLSLAASSVYVANDLFDLEADRRHPSKKRRPMASGATPIAAGLVLVPLLLVASFALAAWLLPPAFVGILMIYVFVSTTYSLRWKRHMSLDVLVLAGLYTLRVVAGGVATGIEVSAWLLSFSMFFFLSLAQLKRYTELERLREAGASPFGSRRGYRSEDMDILRSVGPMSGYISVLVLVLYVSSDRVAALYHRPQVLWLLAPLLLYWVTRVWILAHRKQIDDDPIVFTVRDPVSYLAGLMVVLVVVVATLWR